MGLLLSAKEGILLCILSVRRWWEVVNIGSEVSE